MLDKTKKKEFRKNVLIVGKIPPPYYGTSVWTNILKKSGYFTVFDSKINESVKTIGERQFGKVFRTFFVYLNFIRIIRKTNPKVTLIPISQSLIGYIKDSIFIFISLIYSDKILVFLHGGNFKNWFDDRSLTIKWFVEFTLIKTDGVIVLGDRLKHLFTEFFPYESIFVSPNGINIDFPNVKKNNDQIVTILYLGNLQVSKGIKSVVNSIKWLKNCKVDFKVDVIGNWRDTKTRDWALKFVHEFDLPINFLGPKYEAEKYKHMKLSDIFIFTPVSEEGHPFVIIEALAAGLPVISSNRGAISESVIDNLNGFIVEPNDTKGIADKLRKLIEDKDLRKKMGMESRRLYKKKYTEKNMVERLKAICDEVNSN